MNITALTIEKIKELRPTSPCPGDLGQEELAMCFAIRILNKIAPTPTRSWGKQRTPTRFRKRKRSHPGPRYNRHHRMSIAWWNIEGARHVMATAPDSDPLAGADLWMLCETFNTAPTPILNFKTHEHLATKHARGRPSGGLLAGFRGSSSMDLKSTTDHHIHCRVRGITIIGFYFPPDCPIDDVIDESSTAIGGADTGSIIVLGDFNCRIDNGSERGQLLVSAMEGLGLTLHTCPDSPTYVCHNGSSTIDLGFGESRTVFRS